MHPQNIEQLEFFHKFCKALSLGLKRVCSIVIALILTSLSTFGQGQHVSLNVQDTEPKEAHVGSISEIWQSNGNLYFPAVTDFQKWQLDGYDGDFMTHIGKHTIMKNLGVTPTGIFLKSEGPCDLYFFNTKDETISDKLALRVRMSELFLDGLVYAQGDDIFFTDGTPEVNRRLARIPDILGFYVARSNGVDYILVRSRTDGLWRSDGTSDGTFKILDYLPTSAGGHHFMQSGNLVYFVLGRQYLWVTDGTAELTRPVGPSELGFSSNRNPFLFLFPTPNGLMFQIDRGEYKKELYHIDNAVEDPIKFFEYASLSLNGDSLRTYETFVVDSFLVFRHDNSLWVSNGTVDGTKEVLDFSPTANYSVGWLIQSLAITGSGDIYVETDHIFASESILKFNITDVTPKVILTYDGARIDYAPGDSIMYFGSFYDGVVLKSNGTFGSTLFLPQFGKIEEHLVCNERLLVIDSGGSLGYSDGTPGGTEIISDSIFHADLLFEWNGRCLIYGSNPTDRQSLYEYDSLLDTVLFLQDLYTDTESGAFQDLQSFNGKLLFATGPGGEVLWESDGTTESTLNTGLFFPQDDARIVDDNIFHRDRSAFFRLFDYPFEQVELPELRHTHIFKYDNRFWYLENGHTLLSTDGLPGGVRTELTHVLAPDSMRLRDGTILGVLNNELFFNNKTFDYGNEVWVTNGEIENTRLLLDSSPGINGIGGGGHCINYDNQLLCELGKDLWITDGTEEGTIRLHDDGLDAEGYTFFVDDKVIYSRNNGWYVTDGTPQGSKQIFEKDIRAELNFPRSAAQLGSLILFATNHQMYEEELWLTDGTEEGTKLLKDFVPSLSPRDLTRVNDLVYFTGNTPEGRVLWFTNGTVEGTQIVNLDYEELSVFGDLTRYNNTLYFRGQTEKYGQEIYYLSFRPEIKGVAFEDSNRNGLREDSEIGIRGVPISFIGRDGYLTYSLNQGEYSANLSGDRYALEVQTNDCWETTNTDSVFKFVTVQDSTLFRDIGLKRISDDASVEVKITTGFLRCGFTSSIWISVHNTGCMNLSGDVEFTLDERMQLISVDENSAFVDSTTINLLIDSILPGELLRYQVIVKSPSEEFTGEELGFTSKSNLLSPSGELIAIENYNLTILRCAIDPNDKLVEPQRSDPMSNNYTTIEEGLNYTIRFQNTGNDTAFTVRLVDTLTPSLDVETLSNVTSSHDFILNIYDGHVLEFLFENILLPDSTTNLIGSQGYISFNILPDTSIAEGTQVFNKAEIYFDFNKPIITNETINTFVETLDNDGDGFYFWEDCDDHNAEINSSAIEIPDNDIDENCDGVLHEIVGDIDLFSTLQVKVFLEGPYNIDGIMNANLYNHNFLPGQNSTILFSTPTPNVQPYMGQPWVFEDSLSLDSFDDDQIIVDYVLLSILESSDSLRLLCRGLGALSNDGYVQIHPESTCIIDLGSSYYLRVEHRNHLAVMTSDSFSYQGELIHIDLTNQDSFRDLFSFGQKEVSPGVYAMYAGNGDQDNRGKTDLNTNDMSKYLMEIGMNSSYFIADFDLNGDVNVSDVILLLSNIGVFSADIFKSE